MKIFDTHTHVFPDKIAARVLENLSRQSKGLPTHTLGTYDDLTQRALAAGYTGFMNCPICTKAGQHTSLNAWAAAHNHWPGLSLGGIHPDDDNPREIVHDIRQMGLYGLKLHPEYQSFGLLEPRMEPLWNALVEEGLPVLIHGADDIGFEPPYHSKPADFAELSRRHQGLTIIVAHTGGWDQWDAVERDLVGTNVYIDTSFSYPYMKDKSQFARIIRNHGTDKVLFGTDSPWQELNEAIAQLKAQDFTQKEFEDIFWNNAVKVWGLKHDE